MIQSRIWVVAAALTASCTLEPDDVAGGFATGGGGGDEDEDDGADPMDGSGGETSAGSSGGETSGDPPSPLTSAEGGSSSGAESTGSPDDDPDDGGGPSDLGDCSNFTSVEQLFTYVNSERGQYGGLFGGGAHSRYKGRPWQGESHENFTFSVQFTWDDDLAAAAQAEADAIAAGGGPAGTQQNGSNGLPLCAMAPFWIDGLNASDWKITFAEQPSHWMQTMYASCPPTTFALSPDNQHARMGLHYHDFGGDGPAIDRLGIGAAVLPDGGNGECQVWWVLQFGA